MNGPMTPGGKTLVGMPYTVPMPYGRVIGYTKGSGDWAETVASGLMRNGNFEVVTYGPSYENWTVRDMPYAWRDIPILYKIPSEFLQKNAEGKSQIKEEPPSSEVHVQLPMHGFTRAQGGWGVFADASVQELRAITETTRFFTDWIPLLMGRERFDVLFPQHISLNTIAGAHYMASCGVGISHETCARADMTNRVGGWAAEKMRAFILDSIGTGRTEAPIVAISNIVERMITDPKGPALPTDRVQMIRNPYDSHKYSRIPGLTRDKFIADLKAKSAAEPDREDLIFPTDVPMDGRWAVFVGRPAAFKGVEQLLQSWAVHLTNDPAATKKDILFVIGPELNNSSTMAKLATKLGIRKNVRFLDKRPPIEFINPLHNVSNIAIMTSLNEGDGVVAKEPGAAGNRVVLPDSGGPSEYFHADMGTMVASRDPKLATSSMRGFELLTGNRSIEWGRMKLNAPEIITDYIKWREYYGGNDMSTAVRKQLGTLQAWSTAWDSEEVQEIRGYTAKVLQQAGLGLGAPYVPEELRVEVELLARAFREYGGRDVEAHALAEGYVEELDQPADERARRSKIAQKYVVESFSSKAHARDLGDLLVQAAKRSFDPQVPGSWDQTTIDGFAHDVENSFSATISPEGRSKLSTAFDQLRSYRTDSELVDGMRAFMKAVVRVLGNPQVYSATLPTPHELGMRYNARTSVVLSNIGGFQLKDYLAVQRRIIDEVASRPELQTALYYMQTGQMGKVKKMVAAGSAGNLPSAQTLVAAGLI